MAFGGLSKRFLGPLNKPLNFVLAAGSGLALTAMTLAAMVAIEVRARGVDAVGVLETGLRVVRLGGSYYTTGADQKGPLFQLPYHLAAAIGGRRFAWWYVAAFAILAAILAAVSVGRIVLSRGHSRGLAVATAAGLYIHLILAWNGYSGILYARNITIALLAFSLSEVLLWQQRNAAWRIVVAGVAAGLASQTILTELFGSFVVGMVLLARVLLHRGAPTSKSNSKLGEVAQRVRPFLLWLAGAAGGFLSAPIWYLARGRFSEFWYFWFKYNRFYADSTHAKTSQKLRLGWRGMRGFYRQETGQALVFGAFLLLLLVGLSRSSLRERRRELIVDVGLVAWWAAECAAVIAAQRFSGHHFVLVAVPVGAMASVMFAEVFGRAGGESGLTGLLATAAVIGVSFVPSWQQFKSSWFEVRHFQGFRAKSQAWLNNQDPTTRTARALVDLVTPKNGFVWAWDVQPMWPGTLNRMSGSRYVEKRVLLGYIYGGTSSPNYVPPHAWQQFEQDLERTHTVIVADRDSDPLPPNLPASSYLDRTYVAALKSGEWNLRIRSTSLDRIRTLASGANLKVTAPGEWRSDNGLLVWSGQGNPFESAIDLPSSESSSESSSGFVSGNPCLEVTGTANFNPAANGMGGLDLRFEANRERDRAFFIRVASNEVSSNFWWAGSEQRLQTTAAQSPALNTPFRFLVGRRAAALLMNGNVVAVVERPDAGSNVRLVPQPGLQSIADLQVHSRRDCFEG